MAEEVTTNRSCGLCQSCCKLMPIKDIDKPCNTKCPHQRHKKGCAIYADRPLSCAVWSCEWLLDPLAAHLPRPDLAGYVIDATPDFMLLEDKHARQYLFKTFQIWVDPRRRDAHRDSDLRAYLEVRAGRDSVIPLIRCSSSDAFALIPPQLTREGWIEKSGIPEGREHTAEEYLAHFG